MRLLLTLLLVSSLAAAGCTDSPSPVVSGSPGGAPSSSSSSSSSSSGGGSSVLPPAGGPTPTDRCHAYDRVDIQTLSSNVHVVVGGKPEASETDHVTFTALVGDSAGVSNLVGGVLEDAAGYTYGPFTAADGKSTYTLTLSFAEIAQVRDLTFVEDDTVTFYATFHDNDGNCSSRAIGLTFACRDPRGNRGGACSGVCADTKVEFGNCGGCGHACAANEVCAAGACMPYGTNPCLDTRSVAPDATCGALCKSTGGGCYEMAAFQGAGCGGAEYPQQSCGDVVRDAPGIWVRCDCREQP